MKGDELPAYTPPHPRLQGQFLRWDSKLDVPAGGNNLAQFQQQKKGG